MIVHSLFIFFIFFFVIGVFKYLTTRYERKVMLYYIEIRIKSKIHNNFGLLFDVCV